MRLPESHFWPLYLFIQEFRHKRQCRSYIDIMRRHFAYKYEVIIFLEWAVPADIYNNDPKRGSESYAGAL